MEPLKQKGQETVIDVKQLTIFMKWTTAVDFDLAAAYQTKTGQRGLVYFADLGHLDHFPYLCVRLNKDEGVGEDGCENEEILQISQLDEMKTVWLFCWDYGRVQTGQSARFKDRDVRLTLSNKEPFYLNEMSDGAVRMLCWATLLHSPQLPTLLVIDEPELGLHVAWMNILAEWIKPAARNTQVIIATHSPDLLDHFTEDHLEDILCFSKEGNYFVPTVLSRQKLSNALAEGWQVGDLYRVGAPEVGGWPW